MDQDVVSARPPSPPRQEAIAKFNKPTPRYSDGVLIGNWVEDKIECPKVGTLYFPPKEVIDYEKMKTELRNKDLAQNKLSGTQGLLCTIIHHDSHKRCGNYTTCNDLVYNHLPKPLCGPVMRYYKKSEHQWHPQPDFLTCYGNKTRWGLRDYKRYEWACTDVSDYNSSLYEDTFVPPTKNDYTKASERKARDSSFTSTFRFKMTKPLTKPLQKKTKAK